MTRRTILVAMAGILLVAADVDIAWPGDRGHRHGPHRSDRLATLLEENAGHLGLSEDTVAKIRAIIAESKATGEKLDEEIRESRRGMRKLLSAGGPDEEAAMKQAERIGELETKALKHRLRTLLRIRPLLTEAQIEELHKIRDEHLAPLRKTCQADLEAMCPDVEFPPDMIGCLREHRSEVSEPCRQALESARRERGRRHR